MPRVFLWLATSNLLLLAINAGLGFVSTPSMREAHILLGILTLLFTCFLQVIVFTYFTIAGKMMGQMLGVGRSSLEPLHRAKRLKSWVSRLLGALVLVSAAAAATGAMRWRGYGPTNLHIGMAALTVAAHVFVLFRQYGWIAEHAALFAEVLRRYSQERRSSAATV